MASSPYGGGGFGYQQPGGLGGGTPLGGGAPGSLLGGDRYGGTPLTGGHGAMGSGNRYGGSLLAGDRAGGYQSSGLGAGGLMGSAGGHNQHGGSYGDLGGAPGSGIARSQQPFAPMLFSSPGGSALGGRARVTALHGDVDAVRARVEWVGARFLGQGVGVAWRMLDAG